MYRLSAYLSLSLFYRPFRSCEKKDRENRVKLLNRRQACQFYIVLEKKLSERQCGGQSDESNVILVNLLFTIEHFYTRKNPRN